MDSFESKDQELFD